MRTPKEEETMRLKYRGISYNYSPPAVNYGKVFGVGNYRGATYQHRDLREAPVPQVCADLTYRGIDYHTGESQANQDNVASEVQLEIVRIEWVSVADEARWLMMNHHRAIKRRQQSMLGRLNSEIHLNVDPSQYWNHIQGKVHPSFRKTYERSHAAMS